MRNAMWNAMMDNNENMDAGNNAVSLVNEFYKDKTIFITGATGFLGSLLLEKLLRACYDLNRIYIIVRPKKEKSMEDRKKNLFENEIFEKLRKLHPNFNEKVQVVAGDCEQRNLGLSKEDYQLLVSEVNVIFHCAATVRFNEALKKAVKINVVATKDLLMMAEKMHKLNAFVYVGTAYCHSPQEETKEIFYPTPMDPDKLIDMANVADDDLLNILTPKIIKEWPNTYSYSKAIAEELIRQYGHKLPMAIVRPSIILGTSTEPIAGWTNNFYSFNGVIVGIGVGLIHTFRIRYETKTDFVPADYVINCIITSAWDLSNNRKSAQSKLDVPIYNYSSWSQNPITWERLDSIIQPLHPHIPSIHQIQPAFVWPTENRFLYRLAVFTLHFLPAMIIDGIVRLLGKKPMLVKVYRKIEQFSDVLSYFTMREFRLPNDNTQALFKRLTSIDQQLFDFDMGQFCWEEYFPTYVRGLRVYLMKDSLDTLPQAKKKFFRFEFLRYFLRVLFTSIFCWVLWKIWNFKI